MDQYIVEPDEYALLETIWYDSHFLGLHMRYSIYSTMTDSGWGVNFE